MDFREPNRAQDHRFATSAISGAGWELFSARGQDHETERLPGLMTVLPLSTPRVDNSAVTVDIYQDSDVFIGSLADCTVKHR